MNRRTFLHTAATSGILASFSDLGFLARLPSVSAAEARLDAGMVQLHPEIAPLVRFIEETPRNRLLEETAARIRKGLTYRELLAALLLAGVRNVQPRPVGFKFHAVLVVNSAHLASLASRDHDRWLPVFWALDHFKNSQAADVREGDWSMGPVDEPSVPPAHRARQAFIDAMDKWDEPAADAAVAGLCRSAGAHEIFELFCRYGMRDFREIGHKQIYVANSFRTLEVIGWHHAEPVLRSLAYGLLDRFRDTENPATSDLPADRPYRRNLETVKEIRDHWREGTPDPGAVSEMLETARTGSAIDTSRKALELLNRGVAPESLFHSYFCGAGELLMRAPGILSLHAITFTNAMSYCFQHCRDADTRKMMLLQNAAFLPLYRGNRPDAGTRVNELEPVSLESSEPAEAVEEIFADVSDSPLRASQKILSYLKSGGSADHLAHTARRLIFQKGRDSHDYKFSSAVLEDYHAMPAPWRDRYLAASVFNLKGTGHSDNSLVTRIRAALG